MNRLTRILSHRDNNDNKNKEIIISQNYEKSIQNWKIPAQISVYKQKGIFSSSSDYIIKTIEESIPIGTGYNTFKLLSQSLINEHKKTFKYLHLGQVQVGLKTSTRKGLNVSALICVRDKRHLKFHDSLLGIVESSLCEGPIYFNCFPDFTLSLKDPNILHALCLDIRTEGFEMMKNTENIILLYRIQYKVMTSSFPRVKNLPYEEEKQTTLFVTNIEKSNLKVPKTISWDQVKLPDKWVLENATEPEKQNLT